MIRLAASSDVLIQVYEVRTVARRGTRSDCTLRVGVTGGAATAAAGR